MEYGRAEYAELCKRCSDCAEDLFLEDAYRWNGVQEAVARPRGSCNQANEAWPGPSQLE